MRGLAEVDDRGREQLLGRFHRSARSWKRSHPLASAFTRRHGPLLLVVDGIWITLEGVRYTVLVILVRPMRSSVARLRGLYLVQGDESYNHWMEAFRWCLSSWEWQQIEAIVADGSHGLTTIAEENDWVYQRCQFHLLKDLALIQGKRRGPTQWIRQLALAITRIILNTPSEKETIPFVHALYGLITRSDCPRTVRKKIGGFLKHRKKFRTCYQYPLLRIPKTSNSCESAARMIRERLGVMRGVRTVSALRYWIDIIQRMHPTIRCRSDEMINQIKTS